VGCCSGICAPPGGQLPDLILVLDTKSHYTFISPRCRDVLGYELDDTRDMQFGGVRTRKTCRG
jgi:hypothetical protein